MSDTTYASAVPLTMVRLVDGGYRNVLQGDPISGDSVDPKDLERLVRKGFLVKVDVVDQEAPSGPPAKSSSKGDWEAYARSQGATDENLAGATKDDLIAAYGD